MNPSSALPTIQSPATALREGGAGKATIRRATTADAGTVLTLVLELAAHENSLEHLHTGTEQWKEFLGMPEVIVLLVEKDGQPAGYVSSIRRTHLWTGRDILALDDLYVRPGHRNGGLGELLMRSLASVVAEDRLLITWGVDQKNEAGQRFYRRIGATLRTKVVASWTPEAYSAGAD